MMKALFVALLLALSCYSTRAENAPEVLAAGNYLLVYHLDDATQSSLAHLKVAIIKGADGKLALNGGPNTTGAVSVFQQGATFQFTITKRGVPAPEYGNPGMLESFLFVGRPESSATSGVFAGAVARIEAWLDPDSSAPAVAGNGDFLLYKLP